jgi:hypothetical protein
MTSIEKESGRAWSVEEVATRAGEVFGRLIGELDAATKTSAIS